MTGCLAVRGTAPPDGELNEAPMACRRLPDFLPAHADNMRVLHRMRPFAVVMAGADVIDPHKD